MPTAQSGFFDWVLFILRTYGPLFLRGAGTTLLISLVGTVIGSVLMAMITNVLIMLGVSAYWQAFVFGFILIVSLFIDRYRQRSLNA